ncbi:MAG: hypothetical protein HGA47_02335, partial [Zoogloea sp.]|nr:hypothetical protein [Zoogloea sp.]
MQLLSFEQAPPVSVPLRFFVTAPVFGFLAGLVLIAGGQEVFASRWTPAALAVVHLVVAGFMLQVMVGALMQIMPVAVGANLWRPRLVAGVVHPLLAAGALALAGGFLFSWAPGFEIAVAAIGAGLGVFVPVALTALIRTPAASATLVALRLAALALAVTVLAGFAMALAHAGILDAAWLRWQPSHVAWGLGGWGLVLVSGVAYLVVPMFQLTPRYPPRFERFFVPLVVAVLAAGSALPAGSDAVWLAAGAALPAAGFAALTLDLQRRRRRSHSDATLRFWRFAMACTLAAAACLLATAGGLADDAVVLETGVLVLAGAFMPVIIGMLYKIVPFIVWLHLKTRLRKVPPMTRVIPEARQTKHYWLHLAAVAVLLPAPWWPPLAIPGGALLAASGLWLAVSLAGGWRFCRASL